MSWIDPDCLPQTSGTVERFLPTPEGGIDGLLLQDGTEVHLPTYMAARVTAVIQPGTMVHIRGLKPRAAAMVCVVSIAPDHGAMIHDEGAGGDREARKTARKTAVKAGTAGSIHAVVKKLLHGAHGDLHGALLEDGKVARIAPDAAKGLTDMLVEGATLVMDGTMLSTPHGDIVLVSGVGPSQDAMTPLGKVKPVRVPKTAEEREAAKAERVATRKTEKQTERKDKQAAVKAGKVEAKKAERTAKIAATRADKLAAKKAERQATKKAERQAGKAAAKG